MDFNIDIRKKQLESLKQYIKSSENNVNSVLHSLGWTSKKTLEQGEPKVICPINPNHLIAYKTSEKHLEKCTLHTAGYESNEEYLSEPPEISETNIRLNSSKKVEILNMAKGNKSDFRAAWNGRDSDPMTANRLVSTFSSDERAAIYDYCVKHTEAPPKPAEFTLDLPEDKKELTEKEKMSLERDTKRRRAKYKSVHTSKKSQTEIMREVIDNQMTLYKQWINNKQEMKRKEMEKIHKLEKLKQEQLNNDNVNTNYHYIETTYQNTVCQMNQDGGDQWGQYSNSYVNQYYGNIPTNQGIITDWSHVYQMGIDSISHANADLGQTENGQFTEQLGIESSITNIDNTNLKSYGSENNHSHKEIASTKGNFESRKRSRERRKKSDSREKRSRERRIDRDVKSHHGRDRKMQHSRERRRERRH